MTKVLVVGHVPLPFENTKKSFAPGARTWQLARSLIDDRHQVYIAGIRIPFVYGDAMPDILDIEENGCLVRSMTMAEAERGEAIRLMVAELRPDCIVGSCAYP